MAERPIGFDKPSSNEAEEKNMLIIYGKISKFKEILATIHILEAEIVTGLDTKTCGELTRDLTECYSELTLIAKSILPGLQHALPENPQLENGPVYKFMKRLVDQSR